MIVAIIGLWHLGTVTAACLASAGHTVIGFDYETETVESLTRGRPPVFEPGLAELVQQGIAAGHLRFSSNLQDLARAEIVWITYDTPVDDDDQADVEYVVQRSASIFPHVQAAPFVLISSQLPVGSTQRLEKLYKQVCPDGKAAFAYSPENLRLGKAIDAFTRPERIVVGVRNADDRERIANLLKPFCEKIEWMSVESAEMTKHALNAFLATSVAFANEIATLCERVGADAGQVARGLKSDIRIGSRAYLRPGSAFAGGTLARDISFLVELGHARELPTYLLAAVRASNAEHKNWSRRAFARTLGDLRGKVIAVLGLTYKPGTDTLRRSGAVETCHWLKEQGASVRAYDPAIKNLPQELAAAVTLCASISDALRGVDAALIATEWQEFAVIRADDVIAEMRQPIVLDPGRFLEANLGADKRVRYLTVGKME